MSNTTLINTIIENFKQHINKIKNASILEISPQHENQYMALEIHIKNDAIGYLEVINREVPEFRYATYDDPFITTENIDAYFEIIKNLKKLFEYYNQIKPELKA